jgi:hypothetical protein
VISSFKILLNPGVGGDEKRYSSLHNVQKSIAPAIIFHGTEDTTISLSQMYEYKKRSLAWGVIAK